MFTEKDNNQISNRGLTVAEVSSQLSRFEKGFAALSIVAPAQTGDGIRSVEPSGVDFYISRYDTSQSKVTKFVPASGAASRMFKSLFSFVEKFDGTKESWDSLSKEDLTIIRFFDGISNFAFYDELNAAVEDKVGKTIDQAKSNYMHGDIVRLLLTEDGLNYGNLPKGLLKFHQYDSEIRTASDEHLHEGLAYAESNGEVNLHFTVSPEHKDSFAKHISESIAGINSKAEFNVSYSIQEPRTDTIASDLSFKPFRDEEGNMLFRPAGHGALLANLNDIESDIIFIKNIDNVVPDQLKEETIKYKKVLAGVLTDYQEKAFDLLLREENGADIKEEAKKLLLEMGARNIEEKEISSLLNRPIRVCGMVKNEGEPGGGPFWVKTPVGESLQIVESAQVDSSDEKQQKLFREGTHFNPVDLVCGVKNYKGEKFDLLNYRDDEAGFISEKSYGGQKLLAMELPGLWNGSMANWNTIFVEVPLITFNPVKTVNDLLKDTHR